MAVGEGSGEAAWPLLGLAFFKSERKRQTQRELTKMHYFIAPRSWQYLGALERRVESVGIPVHIQMQPHEDVGQEQPPNRRVSENRNTREAALCTWAQTTSTAKHKVQTDMI